MGDRIAPPRRRFAARPAGAERGFTLIEIIVVIALIGILLFFSVPRFQGTVLRDSSEKSVRWVIYTVRMLRQDAVKQRKTYTLNIDMGAGEMWATHDGMSEEEVENARQEPYELPGQLALVDVAFPDGEKIAYGRAEIRFYPKGYSDRAMIHLREGDDQQMTLWIEPFLPNIKVYDSYVEFES